MSRDFFSYESFDSFEQFFLQNLKNYALACGTNDNVSMIVVKFQCPSEMAGNYVKNTVEPLPVIESNEENDGENDVVLPIFSNRRR